MILTESTQYIRGILPKEHKIKAIGVSILLFINSALELVGLGALLPVFAILLEDNFTEKYSWANWLYQTFKLTNENQLIILLAVGLFIIVLLKNIAGLYIAKLQSSFSLGLYKDFAIRLHQIYYRKGFSFFKNNNSNLINRNVNAATQQFSQNVVLGVLNLFNEFVVLAAIIISIGIYDPLILVVLATTVAPPFLLFYYWVRKKSLQIGEVRKKIQPELGRNVFQSIFGYIDVIINGAEQRFRKRIENNVKELSDTNIKANVYNLAPTRVIESALMLAIMVMIIYGVYAYDSKVELLQLLGIFAVAGYRIMPSINRMMIAINGLNQSKWIFEVLEPLKSNELNNIQPKDITFKRKLELKNLTFQYPDADKPVLNNFNLCINKGETIGFMGPSGAGKTTAMNILLGFLKPNAGQYLVDDTVLDEAHMQAFYQKVGYVQQQVYLVDGSLGENIAFGVPHKDIDQAKLQGVIKQASLENLIEDLPKGLNTLIGENGTKLSGGQRQRVGIARALYFNAEILFFDEATSALDTQTEEEITESIRLLSRTDLTLVIIAHRESTLRYCKRILKINNNIE
ncbi:ABC transporter ATP-binding protein [Saccharicrinis aurantiacus]|uniref:ABC transporter ATP-binding protein n=1 Tax=Saccharicrinis aurantiacus TaxID=1849719 RepID=UPI0009502A4F|nr:ABC transporter ATP-binding protein [Saccharicrinis aurantiacus]